LEKFSNKPNPFGFIFLNFYLIFVFKKKSLLFCSSTGEKICSSTVRNFEIFLKKTKIKRKRKKKKAKEIQPILLFCSSTNKRRKKEEGRY